MLNLKLAKSMMENEEGMNHLLIKVQPEEIKEKLNKPVALFLIIDKSSSMNGPVKRMDSCINNFGMGSTNFETTSKMDYVKQAGERLIDMMKEGDMLGVVSFSEIASKEYDLTRLNKEEKYKAKDRIRALRARGMTNVSDGLETAYKQIPEELKKTHHVKLILLSDGVANYGITDDDGIATLVSGYRKNEVSISTIGVGLDYNSYFMETIATASGGAFYHLEEMEQLNDILTKELETLTTLNTKQAIVSVNVPQGVYISPNMNGYSENKAGEIFLGNVFSPLDILVELHTEEEVEKDTKSIIVKYEYINAKGLKNSVEQEIKVQLVSEDEMDNVETDKEVVDLVKQFIEAKSKKEALRQYEAGQMDALQKNIQSTYSSIDKLSTTYHFNAQNITDEIKKFERTVMSRSLDKSDMKNMYMANYAVTNTQMSFNNKEK